MGINKPLLGILIKDISFEKEGKLIRIKKGTDILIDVKKEIALTPKNEHIDIFKDEYRIYS